MRKEKLTVLDMHTLFFGTLISLALQEGLELRVINLKKRASPKNKNPGGRDRKTRSENL